MVRNRKSSVLWGNVKPNNTVQAWTATRPGSGRVQTELQDRVGGQKRGL